MFSKFLVLSLLAATSAVNLDNYSFEQFVKEFSLTFDAKEMVERKAIFTHELARVQAHNAKGLSWTEGINKFSAMSGAEKKAFYGRSKKMSKNSKAGRLGAALPADMVLQPVSKLPKHVDWREQNIVTAVKDQGHCGSCWAFAATAVIESHVAKSTGLLFDLSTQQIAMCSPNLKECGGTGGCEGATAEVAYDYLTKSTGIYQEFQYPYLSYYGVDQSCAIPATGAPVATISGFTYLPENNYTALMNAIATVGPIAVSVDASVFHAYTGGVFDGCNQAQPDINHAVTLVGYGSENGKDYWLIRNSWSPTYGEKGYIKVLRTNDEEGRCGTDTTPHDGNACAGEDEPQKVCGTCGVLFDSSFPTGAALKTASN